MISNIDELVVFMDEEAAEWGREESDQKTVNGAGIKKQWEERDKFPYPVFYLMYDADTTKVTELPDGVPRAIFELKAMWFDVDGNETARPEFND